MPLQRWIYAVDDRRLSEFSDEMVPEEGPAVTQAALAKKTE